MAYLLLKYRFILGKFLKNLTSFWKKFYNETFKMSIQLKKNKKKSF